MNEFAYMDTLPSPGDSWDSAGGSGMEDECLCRPCCITVWKARVKHARYIFFLVWCIYFSQKSDFKTGQSSSITWRKKRRYFCGHPLYCAPFDSQVAPATQYWVIIVHHHHKRETVCSQVAAGTQSRINTTEGSKTDTLEKKCRNEWERKGWKWKVFYPI